MSLYIPLLPSVLAFRYHLLRRLFCCTISFHRIIPLFKAEYASSLHFGSHLVLYYVGLSTTSALRVVGWSTISFYIAFLWVFYLTLQESSTLALLRIGTALASDAFPCFNIVSVIIYHIITLENWLENRSIANAFFVVPNRYGDGGVGDTLFTFWHFPLRLSAPHWKPYLLHLFG